jgi:TnpA family transposase
MGMGKLTKTIYSKIASLSQADLKNKIKAVENMIDSMRKNAHFCDVTYSNLQYVSNI